METDYEKSLETIKTLKKKAEITRNAHAHVGDKCEKRAKMVKLFVICGSAISIALIFSDYNIFNNIIKDAIHLTPSNYYYVLIIGLLNLLIFITSLIELVLNYEKRAESHYQAVKLLTTLIRDIDRTKDSQVVEDNEDVKYTERYNWINESSPLIPDDDFLESKRRYKLKRSISVALDDDNNIGKSIKQIKNDLTKK